MVVPVANVHVDELNSAGELDGQRGEEGGRLGQTGEQKHLHRVGWVRAPLLHQLLGLTQCFDSMSYMRGHPAEDLLSFYATAVVLF